MCIFMYYLVPVAKSQSANPSRHVESIGSNTCRNLRSPSLMACKMPSLLRSPNLVSPLQKRASTDFISHENLISGYRADMARPLPEQMQCSFCRVHAHSGPASLFSTWPLVDKLLSSPSFPTSKSWLVERLPRDTQGSNPWGSARRGRDKVSSRAEQS